MKNKQSSSSVRLQAKKMLLEQRTMMHKMRLQNNMSYATKYIPTAIGAQIAQSPAGKSPLGSVVARLLLPKPEFTEIERVGSNGLSMGRRNRRQSGMVMDKVLSVVSLVFPLFFGFARKRAFKYGFKAVRALVRLGFKKMFR